MKKIITIAFLFIYIGLYSQLKLVSWNVENLGKSKSDSAISYMAGVLKKFDIIAIQEVVAGYGGSQAVAKLADELNRMGGKWDYVVSEPTSSSPYKTERYAFLWKTSIVKKIGDSWLEKKYHLEIEREPYYGTFEYQSKQITLANFHAITKSKQPETEIKYFKYLPEQYPHLNLIFLGDFNCPQSHSVFNTIKKIGYESVFINQKTSLKNECKNGNCLASEFDNIWINSSKIGIIQKQVIPFFTDFASIKEAREVSDHIPVWVEICFKE
ncbi:MAG TPA: endonuclease [Flavobacterium sp.]|nr:endonuclease [Flavobacterium sp.]